MTGAPRGAYVGGEKPQGLANASHGRNALELARAALNAAQRTVCRCAKSRARTSDGEGAGSQSGRIANYRCGFRHVGLGTALRQSSIRGRLGQKIASGESVTGIGQRRHNRYLRKQPDQAPGARSSRAMTLRARHTERQAWMARANGLPPPAANVDSPCRPARLRELRPDLTRRVAEPTIQYL